ncbi:MAG: hypothetical protein R2867_35240 [Caldilineaceae bacterium]
MLEQGHTEAALAVYRADLGLDNTLSRPSQHPENVWSLHGYVECLHRLDRCAEAEAIQPRLDLALACRYSDPCLLLLPAGTVTRRRGWRSKRMRADEQEHPCSSASLIPQSLCHSLPSPL